MILLSSQWLTSGAGEVPEESAPTCPNTDRTILINGEMVPLGQFPCDPTLVGNGERFRATVIKKEKNLLYLEDFLQSDEIDSIVDICSDPTRFDSSPLLMHSVTQANSYGTNDAVRTSSSCPLLFAYYYMPHMDKLKEQAPQLLPELELTWNITTRAANFLDVSPANIEPLQMLNYQPGQYYKPHHDHRGFYHLSNTQPDRATTILIFLNDVAAGGHLTFDRLGIQFQPRRGDAVVWSNLEQSTGKVDHDMVHQGLPPEEGSEKRAINLWVREEPFTDLKQAAERQQ